MKATLVFEGRRRLSKQHSWAPSRHGGLYKVAKFAADQQAFRLEAIQQLRGQDWHMVAKSEGFVKLTITLRSSTSPAVDWDNCNGVTDAMQGVLVENDRQFYPVTVQWERAKSWSITLEAEKTEARHG